MPTTPTPPAGPGVPAGQPMAFPDGFVWGTATAAYQIEGAIVADGRGPSIWDTFSHQPGATHNGDNGDVACDHYHRLDADLDRLAELGAPAYRFSVAWPRVQPTGKGPANQPGLDFYRRVVDGLCERGLVPAVTLYHWDLPQALEDAGGWTVRDTSERFAEYAEIVAGALGDRVGLWITLNEPWCSAWQGYGSGAHAPGRRDVGAAVAATHHLLLGHGLALEAARAVLPDTARIGITLNLAPVRPASDHPLDVAAARRVDGNLNRLFCEPVLLGRYPRDMLDHYGDRSPGFSVVADGDMEVVSRPIDFLGVNFYYPQLVADPGRAAQANAAGHSVPNSRPDVVATDLRAIALRRPSAAHTAMDWEIDPAALTELLVSLRRTYGAMPVYVTENGASFNDYVGPDGHVRDHERIVYLDGHLRAARRAMDEGVDLRGYFLWSFMDNFEWGYGYSKRFGLIWVDYPTGDRVAKESFAWYHDVVRANALGPGT